MALGDLMGMMKQAKELQEKMQAMQDEVAAMSIEGASGGGLVSVTLNGKGEMKSIRVDPSLLKPDEAEILEDLIVAACTDARTKADATLQDKMREMTGGMDLPSGMKLPI
ncbi:MAG: YbaB/EbfC family nucleoid-associated protein [Hyphomicrobiales bacterium]|nr:YbaB/EbfC family nucleoid-associated protein [Hyphomicrobiales bacterium]